MSPDEAEAFMVKGKGTQHFDPDVIDAFVKVSDILRGSRTVAIDDRPAAEGRRRKGLRVSQLSCRISRFRGSWLILGIHAGDART